MLTIRIHRSEISWLFPLKYLLILVHAQLYVFDRNTTFNRLKTGGQVIYNHALRNSMLPAITVIALDVGYLIGGVIVVEEVFAFPGIGRQLILAIQNRDLPMLQAGALIMALTYALANLAADLAYASLDKRIQFK